MGIAFQKQQWTSASAASDELSLHQLAPYIGRMKSSMAQALVLEHTKPGDLVVDPFCGCGVSMLEAAANGRKVLAGDWNPYATLLTRAKLFPPRNLKAAERRLADRWRISREYYADQDLRSVPKWVRSFFHPETLRAALAFRDACVANNDSFLLAILLSVLHHQRPGFLSYPSSHLVPYLRDKQFPRSSCPELYEERDVFSRLQAKVRRTFKRPHSPFLDARRVINADAREFPKVRDIGAVITSPPYMNELDYVRDNRLRLWFIERHLPSGLDLKRRDRESEYVELMSSVCGRLAGGIKPNGYFVLIVGDATRGGGRVGRTEVLTKSIFDNAPELRQFELTRRIRDVIPDIRRSRQECKGTKAETILIYRKLAPSSASI